MGGEGDMKDEILKGKGPSTGIGKKSLRPLGAAGKVGKKPAKPFKNHAKDTLEVSGGKNKVRVSEKGALPGSSSRREEDPGSRLGKGRERIRNRSYSGSGSGSGGCGYGDSDKDNKKDGSFVKIVIQGPRLVRRLLTYTLIAIATFAVFIVVGCACVYGYLYFSKSDYLIIKHHDIKGIFKVSREEVLEAAGLLNRRVGIIRYDTVAAIRSLKSLPWVEDASITRTPLPDGVTIRITEYKPKALVSLGEIYYLDKKGRPFKSLSPGESPDFPLVSGFTLDELLNEGPLTKKAVSEIFELMDILSERNDELRLDNISEFHHDPDIGVTVYTKTGGTEIRLGFQPFSEKIVRLGKVIERLKKEDLFRSVVFFNLESVPRVIVRYANGRRPAGFREENRERELGELLS
jgi:cell division protein FtsQ